MSTSKSKEKTPLLLLRRGLSVGYAAICIVDVFGVFPIIALPKSIIDSGVYGALLVVPLVVGVQTYTACLLGRCWLLAESLQVQPRSRSPYAALAELTCGRRVACVVTLLLDATVFLGGIPNILVASQTLQLLGRRISDNHVDLSFCAWIVVISALLCPLLWLGSPKDMKLLCTLSAVAVLATFVSLMAAMAYDDRATPQPSPLPETNGGYAILTACSIITFQFDIHPTLLTIQVDMRQRRQIAAAVCGGFGVTFCMFAAVTWMAAMRYGNTTKASLLGSLPPESYLLHFAALLVALQLCLTLVVGNSALYQHLEDCMGIAREFNAKRCILRSALCMAAVLLAEAVPRFDVVMATLGALFICPLVFILPPLFFVRLHPDTSCEVCFALAVMLAGMGFTATATYVNVRNAIEYSSFNAPCLYNFTAILLSK